MATLHSSSSDTVSESITDVLGGGTVRDGFDGFESLQSSEQNCRIVSCKYHCLSTLNPFVWIISVKFVGIHVHVLFNTSTVVSGS